MPLTGQAKIDYQRDYMRKRRSNTALDVRPSVIDSVRPDDVFTKEERAALGRPEKITNKPEPQSHNSMMVGYVPPTD